MLLCLLAGMLLSFFHLVFCLPATLITGQLHPLASGFAERIARPASLVYVSRKNRLHSTGKGISLALLVFSDILTVLLGAIMLLLILYVTNNGAFRMSAPILLFCGYFLSQITLTKFFALIIQLLFVFCKAAFVWILALAAFPFYRIARYLWRKSMPMRRRCNRYFEERKLARAQRASKKKQLRAKIAEPIVKKPQHDGRHVYCVGHSTALRNLK